MQRSTGRTRQLGYALVALAGAGILAVVVGTVASGDAGGTSRDERDAVVRDYCTAAGQSALIARDVTLSTEERTTRLAELSQVMDELAPPDLRRAQQELAEHLGSISSSGPSAEEAEELQRLAGEVQERTRRFCGLDGPGSFLDLDDAG